MLDTWCQQTVQSMGGTRVCKIFSSELCFQCTGADFAGPLFVKPIYLNDQKLHKAYICLLTCATSRAIHLELVPDLTGL